MKISSGIFPLLYLLCHIFSLHATSVAVQRQQNAPVSSTFSLVQLQFHQQCFNNASIPYSEKNSTFSNEVLQQDISTITTALLLAQSCKPIIITKARLNTLFFNPSSTLPSFKDGQTLIAQRYCDNTGKLSYYGQDKKFAQSLQQTVTQGLPSEIFRQLFKLFDQNKSNELLKFQSAPTWQGLWNTIWQNQKIWLATQPKKSSCSIEQAQDNQYHKKHNGYNSLIISKIILRNVVASGV